MTGVLIRRGNSTGAERKRLCEDRGRDWSDAAMRQGRPGTTEEERVKEGNVLGISEGA